MIYPLIILSAFIFAYEEFCEWMQTFDYDKKEHLASIGHRISLLVIGYGFAKFGNIIEIPLMLGIYWLCTDGFMNLLKRRSFFSVSLDSGNPFEKWNIVKFLLILIGIGLIWTL